MRHLLVAECGHYVRHEHQALKVGAEIVRNSPSKNHEFSCGQLQLGAELEQPALLLHRAAVALWPWPSVVKEALLEHGIRLDDLLEPLAQFRRGCAAVEHVRELAHWERRGVALAAELVVHVVLTSALK